MMHIRVVIDERLADGLGSSSRKTRVFHVLEWKIHGGRDRVEYREIVGRGDCRLSPVLVVLADISCGQSRELSGVFVKSRLDGHHLEAGN